MYNEIWNHCLAFTRGLIHGLIILESHVAKHYRQNVNTQFSYSADRWFKFRVEDFISRRRYLVICLRLFINNSETIPQIISGKSRPTWCKSDGRVYVPQNRPGGRSELMPLPCPKSNVGHPNHSQSLRDSPTQNHLRNTLRSIINLHFI
jgi:hypothetical protein